MFYLHDGIVHTITEKCQRCYTCVRNCPARAIKIQEGRAQVIKERCVGCGTCVRVCSQKAKSVKSDTGMVWEFFTKEPPVIAILCSSFPAAFANTSAGQLVTALKRLGFTEVMEAAFGAELVGRAYRYLISRETKKRFILSCCPAVIDFIEKFYPHLTGLIMPVVSPMIAMGRAIKAKYDYQARVVFIGPCIATKVESENEAVSGAINAILTFVELKEMLAFKDIIISDQEESECSGPKPNWGRLCGVAGGLLKIADLVPDAAKNDVILATGKEQVLEVLEGVAGGSVSARFIGLSFCEGCVNGPMIGNELSSFRRKELVIQYTQGYADAPRTEEDIARYGDINLSRSFTPQALALRHATQSDLNEILAQIDRGEGRELNCGACGYPTCRELAAAIFQGLAEKEMCWPYLIETLEASERELTEVESRRFYLEHISQALEEERKHIARELHDSVTQTLVAILHKLENYLEDKACLPTGDTQSLWRLREDVRSVLHEVRQFSHNLRPAILDDLGLVASLRWLARQQKMQLTETDFRVAGPGRQLPGDVQLALFRVAQEALRNIYRHSGATHAKVSLRFGVSKTILTVADNGKGFRVPDDFAELAQLGKLGLVGIRERIQLLGGRVNVESKVGKGTTITVEVPA